VRIASFNLENLSDEPSGEASADARHAILRPQLDRLHADILCLQEVDSVRENAGTPRSLRALDALLEGTAYADFHRACTKRSRADEPRDRHNLVVLSRWPIGDVAQYANDLVPPPHYRCVTAHPPEQHDAIGWDRPIHSVRVDPPGGKPVHVINMHLKAPLASFVPGQKIGPFAWKTVSGWAEGFYLASMRRAGQALEARMVIDRIFDADPGALLAVCGDFNAQEQEVPFRILTGDTEDTGNGGLAGRELVALEHSLPEHQRFTVIHAGRKQMLDHILVSRPLLSYYKGMEVHNEALGDEVIAYTMVDRTPESYHAPVVAAFDIPGTDQYGR